MATGSSTAEVALILVDARKGVLRQTRRHAMIAWLLGIRRLLVAINKMDLVDFDEQTFSSIREDFTRCAKSFPGAELHFVPLSALTGENVIHSEGKMPWYDGQSLLQLLETIPADPPRTLRFASRSKVSFGLIRIFAATPARLAPEASGPDKK